MDIFRFLTEDCHFDIWIDAKGMESDIFDGMAQGVINSSVIISFLSIDYEAGHFQCY